MAAIAQRKSGVRIATSQVNVVMGSNPIGRPALMAYVEELEDSPDCDSGNNCGFESRHTPR